MRLASSTQVVYGEGVLGQGIIPKPPQQAGQGFREGCIPMPPPAPPHTVLLQALRQKHLPAAQRAAPASVCGQLGCAYAQITKLPDNLID